MRGKPAVGGFPYLAETMRDAGVRRNVWSLPSCQSVFITDLGNVAVQGKPLIEDMVNVPPFDEAALVRALRADQAGESTFEQFLLGAWSAGVVSYVVDFGARKVAYFGVDGEKYEEEYPSVTLS